MSADLASHIAELRELITGAGPVRTASDLVGRANLLEELVEAIRLQERASAREARTGIHADDERDRAVLIFARKQLVAIAQNALEDGRSAKELVFRLKTSSLRAPSGDPERDLGRLQRSVQDSEIARECRGISASTPEEPR